MALIDLAKDLVMLALGIKFILILIYFFKSITMNKINDLVEKLVTISNEISFNDLEQILTGIYESIGNSLIVI